MRPAFVFLISLLIASCSQPSQKQEVKDSTTEDVLTIFGNWESSINLDKHKTKEVLQLEDPTQMEIHMKGRDFFGKGGGYHGEGLMAITITIDGDEMPFKFDLMVDGNWELNDSLLTISTESGSLVPKDEYTREASRKMPQLREMFTPQKGGSTTSTILSHTKSQIVYRSSTLGGIEVVMERLK